MANFNLTTQELKDTYEQLVQVSGSALVNGTGSLVNAFDYPSNSSYNTFSSSVAVTLNTIVAGSGSADWSLITNKPAGLVSGSSQVNLSLAFGTASKAISSSYATNASTADFTVLANTANESTLVNVLSTTTNASFPVTFVSSDSNQQVRIDASAGDFFYNPSTNRLSVSNLTVANTIVGNIETASFALSTTSASRATSAASSDTATSATTATSASFATNANNLDGLDSTAFAQLALNNNFSGTQNFLNIAVSGTASFAYVEQITGSAVIIGEEFIILNTSVPAARYAGLKVYDTGSTESTASFLFDGLYNDWFYQYSGSDGTDFGVVLFGPEYGTIGTPSYPTVNRIQKGTGGHHLVDSNITDNGTLVSVSTPFTATQITASTGFKGNLDGNATTATSASRATSAASADTATSASFATFATTASFALNVGTPSALVAGTGTNSLRSALTSIPAVSAADLSIAIGNDVTIESLSTGMIAIGNNINSTNTNRDHSIAIGGGVILEDNGANSVAIGSGSRGEDSCVSIGAGASSVTAGVAVGADAIAGADFCIAIGFESNATSAGFEPSAIAIGRSATASAADTIAIGRGVAASAAGDINIGSKFIYNNALGQMTLSGSSVNIQGQIFSPVFSGSIASSTSSIDFNEGNFAVLTLTAATHIANPSNIKSGTTYTLVINSGSLASTYGTSFKFAGGTKPTLSNGVDIVTMVSDGSRLFATGLANFS